MSKSIRELWRSRRPLVLAGISLLFGLICMGTLYMSHRLLALGILSSVVIVYISVLLFLDYMR